MNATSWMPVAGVLLCHSLLATTLPLRFETAPGGALVSRSSSYSLRLDAAGIAVYARDAATHRVAAVTTRIRGANPAARPQGDSPMQARANYLTGADPSRWRTGAPMYERALYRGVYPGIDLVFHGAPGALEYDFVAQPGADPRRIALDVSGGALRLDSSGALVISTEAGDIRWKAPAAYQLRDGVREPVPARFALAGRRVRFSLGAYDRARPLVIDPTLVYASYLGGSDNEGSRAFAADSNGNFYITGFTFSNDLPRTGGSFQSFYKGGTTEAEFGGDAFIAKFNSSGSLVYVTYLGGRADESGMAIAADSAGNAYVTGYTGSSDFPTTAGAYQRTYAGGSAEPNLGPSFGDAFVAKLNPAGNALLYSTYLGGAADDKGAAIAVDGAGNAYIGGTTLSTNFPARNAAQGAYKGAGGIPILCASCGPLFNSGDGFLAKLKPDGSDLVYSTYLGGALDDAVTSLAVDASGNVYAGGATLSRDFPTLGAYQSAYGGGSAASAQPVVTTGDGFLAKLDASGKLAYSTYLGGGNDDIVMALALDSAGAVYATGFTTSANFPVTSSAAQKTFKGPAAITGQRGFAWGDAFVAKLAPSGASLAYSTYLGGSADDAGFAIAVDGSGNAYVGGFTSSGRDFPISSDALQKTWAGELAGYTDNTGDGFLTVVSPDGGAFSYSSYYGGAADEVITGVALGARGTVYLGGLTTSTNLPTTSGAAQPRYGGINLTTETTGDAFVAIVTGVTAPGPVITSVVNGLSFTPALAPSTVAAVFGSNLPASASAGAAVNGTAVTVLNASASQWLIAIPATAAPGAATVTVGGSAPFNITLAQYAPALATVNNSGSGPAVAQRSDGSAVSASNPVTAGDTVVLTATGLGAAPVTVTIGGVPAPAISSVQGQPASYQVTAAVPASLAAGNANVTITVGGVTSNTATLAVKAGATATGPVITAVQNGASFQPGIAANTWITIAGANLATQSDGWESAISAGKLPATLDGVSVSVGGKPAYVRYISPTQINAVAPDIPAGPVAVTVTNPLGTSAAFNAAAAAQSPAFFLWPGSYVVATRQDYSLAVKNGTFPGAATVAAKPGDVLILWGTGFGPANPPAPFGVQLPSDTTYYSANPVTVSLVPAGGGASIPATVYGAALAPGFAALYQIAIQLPATLADGDYSLVATVGGASSPVSALITVQR